ncbi:hypothetical protein Tco_1429285, partial [Tanacetum coccineum]
MITKSYSKALDDKFSRSFFAATHKHKIGKNQSPTQLNSQIQENLSSKWHITLTNQALLESEAYMTHHAYATGEKTPKPKSTKKKADSESSPKTKLTQASKGKRIKTIAKEDKPAKKKQSITKSKGLTMQSSSLTEAKQIKLATKISLIQTHSSHTSGSGADEGTEDDDDEVNVSEDDDDDNEDDDDNDDDDGNNDDDDNDAVFTQEKINKESSPSGTLTAQISTDIAGKFEKTINGPTILEVIDDEDKDEEPSAGSNQGSKRRRAGKEPESTNAPKEKTSKITGKSTEGSKSYHKSAQAEEPMHTIKDLEELAHQEFVMGDTKDKPNEETSQHPDWFQKPANPLTPDRDWNKTLPTAHGHVQPWLSTLAQKEDTMSPGLIFELMKGSCKSLVELEYFFEEVYKATTDQLDWNNPVGQQYLHDMRKPLPLIPNSRGHQVIPFDHFINNDLTYLSGGVSSRTYTTSVTKTKAADYGNIKWIEDLVLNRMWSQVPVSYDKHELWGISHWGRKQQQFYGFAANRESAHDVYSKCRIIAVTKLQIVKWHNYKHLDWINVCRDDDKLYKFKEGDFNRLHIQDIEDMLLLLVQDKLTNLIVEERRAFNVSLRMFTKSIIIQRRVEDLQLGVKSYQKKLNLTNPDTYKSDLKRKEAYTAYSNTRGFIYQNKDKKNRLMRIDELYKFSDGTLNDVRTSLDDQLKGIRMKYLPQTIWRQSDRDKAGAMIQAIDKQLKTRRIMR